MRWLTLYARSRQVPASLAVLVISAVTVWALARDGGEGQVDPRIPVLVLATGVMAASVGLSGQDLALDRTASIRWVPRRAAHVLLGRRGRRGGAADCGDSGPTPGHHRVRRPGQRGPDGTGRSGRGARGGQYAWTLPFAWLSFACFAPSATSAPLRVATWMVLPPGSTTGACTALVLAVTGTMSYAVAGPDASVRFLQSVSFRRPVGE